MSPKASTRLLATQSDERLAAMAREGHDRAFEALVQRYRRPLLRYCRRLCIADGRAEDIVQQTLLQAWSALRRGAPVRELRPWLYRIAHNTAVNLARQGSRDGSSRALDLDEVSGVEPAVAVEPDLAEGLALREALTDMAALPPMQREVIFRTALAGHSHEEVATALGISDGAVRGLLYRARATLRTAISALTPPPLLAFLAGSGQGVATERIGELAAGGGSIGLGGLLLKGGLAVVAAGTLVTGAAIVHDSAPSRHYAHAGPRSGAGRETAALGAPGSRARSALSSAATGSRAGVGGSSAPSAARRPAHPGVIQLKVHTGPSPRRSAPLAPRGSAPTSTTVHIPAPSGTSPPAGSGSAPTAPTEPSSGGPSGGGSQGGSGGGSSGGGSSGGGSGSGGSGGSGTGSGGGGTGSGGSGSGSGGGTGGGGSESSGGSGSGGGSESPPPPSGGSGSPSSGPVGTIVNEVSGLLEHTIHGVLGH